MFKSNQLLSVKDLCEEGDWEAVGSAQQALWMHSQLLRSCLKSKKQHEVTSYAQRTSGGGLPHPFSSRSKRGQSNRISEHAGGSQHCGNKESSSPLREIWANKVLVMLTSNVLPFSILVDIKSNPSFQQGILKKCQCGGFCFDKGALE